jgi:ParB-like chromosome segregation protein Spo0J
MTKKFDAGFIEDTDNDSVSDKPVSNKKEVAPAGHAKLPDISEALKIFGKKDETTSVGTTDSILGVETKSSNRKIDNQNNNIHKTRSMGSSFIPDERTVDGSKEEIEETENDIKQIKEGSEVVVFLKEILVDPAKNISRSGKPWKKTDPEVIALAMTIKRSRLIQAPEIRPLPEPIQKDDGSFYRYELVSGYKRFAALEYIGYEEFRFVLFEDLNDDEAVIHNGLENWGRSDPTEYDLAVYCNVVAKRKGWNAETIARRIKAKTGRIESLLLIINKCPPELLEAFRLSPTPEMRRDLARVSLINRPTQEETYKAMLEEWMRIQNDKNRVDNNTSNSRNHNGINPSVRNTRYRSGDSKVTRLRNEFAQYSEWFDSTSNSFRPITEEMREFGETIFRHLQSGKGEKPFR